MLIVDNCRYLGFIKIALGCKNAVLKIALGCKNAVLKIALRCKK